MSCSLSIEYVLAPATFVMEIFFLLLVFTTVGATGGVTGSTPPGVIGGVGGSGAG